MSVAETSLQAYQNLIKGRKLSPMRRNVLFALYCANKPMSSAMLEDYARDRLDMFGRLPRCTITGRLNELEKIYKLIIIIDKRICKSTGKVVQHYIVLKDK